MTLRLRVAGASPIASPRQPRELSQIRVRAASLLTRAALRRRTFTGANAACRSGTKRTFVLRSDEATIVERHSGLDTVIRAISPVDIRSVRGPRSSAIEGSGTRSSTGRSRATLANSDGMFTGTGCGAASGALATPGSTAAHDVRAGKAAGTMAAGSCCTRRGGGSLIVTDGPSGAGETCGSAAPTRTSGFGRGLGTAFAWGYETGAAIAATTTGAGGEAFAGAGLI